MQRPVMNPNFYEEAPKPKKRLRPTQLLVAAMWRVVRLFCRLLTFDPFSRIVGFRVEEGTPATRFMRGLFYRLAFVPVMIALIACAVVWTATHPRSVTAEVDPGTQGIYYEAVTFLSPDQVPLEGWLVPVLDAQHVLQDKDQVLKQKHPAVVLAHDIGQRREQMLPLIKPLHEAGFVILAINLRGGGRRAATGETFGLLESGDVKAAVEVLRKRAFVDPNRVAVVGCGTGASAALLAAQADGLIAAVVADAPIQDSRDLTVNHLMPQSTWLTWLSPLCKWTFEISYGVDAEDVELKNFVKLFDSRPVLMVNASGTHGDPSDTKVVQQISLFLTGVLPARNTVADAKH